ncbi:hypothetical protein CSKR_113240 [Clonorchis sinensis]|uniref:Uncharacterized protein n=1 Tax=Clonorchis sinensis TaxID=79923 RepID=A0A3R7GVN2_CLOSI|nr:hypothetical protein CSKR_113240 [Clonorchis sinensis]
MTNAKRSEFALDMWNGFCLLQTIGQGSKTLICILFTKLNIHLLLERVFLNFPVYPLTVTQMQANATKRLHKFRNRSHFSRDAKRIYEKTYYSHASSIVSTVTQVPTPLCSRPLPLSFASYSMIFMPSAPINSTQPSVTSIPT